MKQFFIFSLLLFTTIFHASAQYEALIKHDARILVDATIKEDYNTVIKYTYPALVTAAGGNEKLLISVKQSMAELKRNNMTITGGELGEPGPLIRANNELYSLLSEKVIIKVKGGTVSAKSSILAISKDKGKSWYFMDIGSLDSKTMNTLFPGVEKQLNIPLPSAPVFVADSGNKN